jgi:hypothetical protein
MSLAELKNRIAREFGTPAVVIDLDRVEANIARVQAVLDGAGVANRPHIKTHKIPALAKLQIEKRARHNLPEARRGRGDGGCQHRRHPGQLQSDWRGAGRAARRARPACRIAVAADNPVTLASYTDAGRQAERPIEVVIECDTGRKRAGVGRSRAVALAAEIRAIPSGIRRLPLLPDRTSWPETQAFRRALGRAGARARAAHRLDRRHPEPANVGKLAGATAPRRHLSSMIAMLAAGVARRRTAR